MKLAIVVLAITLIGSTAASARPEAQSRRVSFTTLWHASGEGTGKWRCCTDQGLDGAYVFQRRGDVEFVGPVFLSNAHLAQIDGLPWGKRFVILVGIVRPTTGYSVTVKRITYQRVNAEIEQFCVIAQISRPREGQPVERRRTVSAHVVQIPRRGLGFSVSSAAILRGTDGKLISTGLDFIKPGGGSIGSVRPSVCRR